MVFVSASIIIDDKKILLVKRAKTVKLFPGFWTIPGGGREEDELAEEIAIRETKEEVGLDFTPNKLFKKWESKTGNLVHTFLGGYSGDIILQPEEIEDYGWFNYDEAEKLDWAFQFKEILPLLKEQKLIE
ncbi:hypothetical protein C0585_07060 [Candidatus Woesearchaeota archaeon]|nr:MAG: hypothetical protein C0585_07060 [Candidatus Woesearchaeota archaeon]